MFICSFIIHGYLGGSKNNYTHLLGPLLQMLILIIYSYAIFRYRLLEDSKIIAARNVIRNMSEVFVLADNRDDSIVEVNRAAIELLEYSEEELLEKKVLDIFYIGKSISGFEDSNFGHSAESAGQYEGYLRTKRGKRIPVEFNISNEKVEKIGFSGSVIVANDVSEMLGFIERQKERNNAMNVTYAELKKKRDFLKRFQDVAGERGEQKQDLVKELEKLKTAST